jgi:hypothetical protein
MKFLPLYFFDNDFAFFMVDFLAYSSTLNMEAMR